ncbi:MAG TPA: hypothetical protein IGR64_03275, partial [Leptolyngbyaceae cyanobacterium M65_K2018_010]|nr:hypothetical protein [Leptolyngbyaceae cyanobacterium M65_K2018_010]
APPTPTPPPTVPLLPESVPAAIAPNLAGIVGMTPTPEAQLGIGHLRPSNLTSLAGQNWRSSPLLYADWLRSIALPIYAAPGGDLWAWLINGWLMVAGADPLAVGQDASFWMVQAGRGLYSFPVMEVRSDGWFRFQYTPLGTAWSHVAYLNLGALGLTLESWEDHLETADRIQFRKHGLSQPLRSGPQGTGRLRSLVSSHSLIRPLEVQGDWVRVQVTQPVAGCTPLPGSTTEEGWMRWRDANQTLLVWFGTEEGCTR